MNTLLSMFIILASLIGPTESNSSSLQSIRNYAYQTRQTYLQVAAANSMRMSSTDPDAADASIVIAMDVSDSMYGVPLDEAKDMALYLISAADENTPVAIVTFANSAKVVQNYTTDRQLLEQAIIDAQTQGATALYDGVYESVNLATTLDSASRIVVLLSDGGEYGGQSAAQRYDGLQLAEDSNVTILPVGIGAWTDSEYLLELADGTQGELFAVDHVTELSGIYEPVTDFIQGVEPSTSDDVVIQTIPPLATTVEEPVEVTQVQPETTAPGNTQAFISDPVDDEQPLDSAQPSTSGLVEPDQPQFNQSGTVAVVFAIDVSDSMYGYPLERASTLSQDFVKDLDPSIPVAIVTFANQAEIVQNFTTNRVDLETALAGLQTKGVTALYDGTALAVDVAASADATNPVVILLSDGGEYGEQSTASREEGLVKAQANGIAINAIGIGNWIDEDYLTGLTQVTGGELYLTASLDDMDVAYTSLMAQFENVDNNAVLQMGATVDETPDLLDASTTLEQPIVAEPNEIADLGIEASTVAPNIAQGIPASDAALLDETDAVVETAGTTVTDEVAALESEMGITNNIMPISIDITDDTEILRADLTLNGFLLASFTEEPIEYDLDLNMLNDGIYQMTLQIQNIDGDIRVVNTDFEVNVINYLPSLGAPEGNDGEAIPGFDTPVLDDSEAPRLVLVDGLSQDLSYEYSLEGGLEHANAVEIQEVVAVEDNANSLGAILAAPLDYVPAPIREALTTSNPELVAIVIIIMTIILLPPGLFTLYWMMYTWNHPDKLEESRSPREFVEPHYSFTAILPARKEEAVIRQTIHSVNNIDYPADMKEILIMIRDEDDDETIAETKRAIEEIGDPNVRLITFTEGPKNKPNGLNRGLAASKMDVVCIFDAEDDPHPEIYQVINTVMVQKEADVVQSGVQLMNFESTWFSSFNCLEYFFWFKSGLHAFTRKFKVTPLGGNTVFFKREWLNRINGWDESCLTEDADVGFRLTAQGAKIEIVYDEKHATQEETPDTAESFIKQRTRWVQGFYQIFLKGDWAKLPTFTQKVIALYILLNSTLQAAMLIFLPIGIYIAMTQQIPVPLALLSYLPIYILLLQMLTNLIGIREFTSAYGKRLPLFFTFKMILYYYPFQLMMALSALRALYRMVIGQAAWEKTAHSNLHRVAMGSN